MVTVSIPLKSSANRKFRLEGSASTRAEAVAEAAAKLAITNATMDGNVSISDSPSIGESALFLLFAGAGDAANAVFVLKSGSQYRTLRMQEVSTSYKNPDGTINVTDPIFTALGVAYRDGSGNGGYSVIKGRYTRK